MNQTSLTKSMFRLDLSVCQSAATLLHFGTQIQKAICMKVRSIGSAEADRTHFKTELLVAGSVVSRFKVDDGKSAGVICGHAEDCGTV